MIDWLSSLSNLFDSFQCCLVFCVLLSCIITSCVYSWSYRISLYLLWFLTGTRILALSLLQLAIDFPFIFGIYPAWRMLMKVQAIIGKPHIAVVRLHCIACPPVACTCWLCKNGQDVGVDQICRTTHHPCGRLRVHARSYPSCARSRDCRTKRGRLRVQERRYQCAQ